MAINYDAIIFDFDGTLYDNKRIANKLIHNYPMSMMKMLAERKTRKELKGKFFGSEGLFRQAQGEMLCKKGGFSDPAAAMAWYSQIFQRSYLVSVLKKYYKPRANVNEVFATLKEKGIKFSIFSDYSIVKERIAALGIDTESPMFMASSEQYGGLKPAPEPLLELARLMGVEPAKILVVGDRDDTDGEGARRAGMQFVQIDNHSKKHKPIEPNHPFVTWDEFSAMI